MIQGTEIMEVLVELMPPVGVSAEDIDRKVKDALAEMGYNVDDVFAIGNTIVMMATQAEEPPEQTVVGAWVTGVALGSLMGRKGRLS